MVNPLIAAFRNTLEDEETVERLDEERFAAEEAARVAQVQGRSARAHRFGRPSRRRRGEVASGA
jgi:hypothetical protein